MILLQMAQQEWGGILQQAAVFSIACRQLNFGESSICGWKFLKAFQFLGEGL